MNLNKYKDPLKEMILTNKDLQKLISIDKSTALSEPNLKNPYSLFEPVIFNPTPIIVPRVVFKSRYPYSIDEAKTFLLIRFIEYNDAFAKTINKVDIIITVGIHQSLSELSNGESRMDRIQKEISDFLVGKLIGLKPTMDKGKRPVYIDDNYDGCNLIYSFSDFAYNFNNLGDGNG